MSAETSAAGLNEMKRSHQLDSRRGLRGQPGWDMAILDQPAQPNEIGSDGIFHKLNQSNKVRQYCLLKV